MPTSREETRLVRLERSPRFRDGRFHNTAQTRVMRQPFSADMALAWLRGVEVPAGPAVEVTPTPAPQRRAPAAPLPLFDATRRVLASPPASGLRLTWLGHSTVLIEIDGVRLLTDPVWGDRASPVSFAGPRRFHPPPLALEDLPPVDAVILSHDHYDHLDAPTIRALARGAAPGFSGRFITTLGVGRHLERLGVAPERVVELDWGGGEKVGDVSVVAVPAQHFSGRGPFDRNATLWAGMVVLGPRHRVFFSGDTGPTPEHRDIGASFGPFDVAMFEIGAYHPAWGDIHLGPDAAYGAFTELSARALLPVHWGTFDLALHSWEQPAERLYQLARSDGAPLLLPRLGEPLGARSEAQGPWWRELGATAQPAGALFTSEEAAARTSIDPHRR